MGLESNVPNLDLTSAKTLLSRAKAHQKEYQEMMGGELWKIEEGRDPTTGQWTYVLRLNRECLEACKPIIGDCANNLNSALDNVVSAMARANGTPRDRKLYYPLRADSQEFELATKKLTPKIGQGMVDAILRNHTECLQQVSHLIAVKAMANTAKHWELLPATAVACAICLQTQGEGRRIFQVPTAWLNERAKTKEWKRYVEQSRQGDLFDIL